MTTRLVSPTLDNSLPTLDYKEIIGSLTVTNVAGDVAGLSCTVTVRPRRYIRITGKVNMHCTVASMFEVYVMEGTTEFNRATFTTEGGKYRTLLPFAVIVAPSAGVHTYKFRAISTGGNATLEAGANTNAFIHVEDIGPVV